MAHRAMTGAALAVTLSTASGCALFSDLVDETQDVVHRYCTTYTQDEREALRARINAGSAHELAITCEGDTPPDPEA